MFVCNRYIIFQTVVLNWTVMLAGTIRILNCSGCGRCTVAEAQADLVLDSGWPSLALLRSEGEWGDEGTNPKDERCFIATAVNRVHAATVRRSRNYCNNHRVSRLNK